MRRKRVVLIWLQREKKFLLSFFVICCVLLFYNGAVSIKLFNDNREQSKIYQAMREIKTDGNLYSIYVDLDDCKLYVFKGENIYKEYKCSGGKPSTPSPIGTWTIISKDTWGEGFGGRWMGFNVPWGTYSRVY